MLKRITLIQGIGNYQQTRGGGAEFGPVTVVYGENRCGKSTLCDVLQSLSCNEPSYILNRQSIPGIENKPAEVEIQFDTVSAPGPVAARFQNSQWQHASPVDSSLYVFDHSFIHRNVLTGTKPERHNSENATDFILGEQNAALYRTLEQENTNLRNERANLTAIQRELDPHISVTAALYANSPLPSESKPALSQSVTESQTLKRETATIIANSSQIRARQNLSGIDITVGFDEAVEAANELLSRSIANAHQTSKALVDNHVALHVDNPTRFNGWAREGLAHGNGETCPFCSQRLSVEANNLITAYQTAFDDQFDLLVQQVGQDIEAGRTLFDLPITDTQLEQKHNSNQAVFQVYGESSVIGNAELQSLLQQLDTCMTQCRDHAQAAFPLIEIVTEQWRERLGRKSATPYAIVAPLDGTTANQVTETFNHSLAQYDELVNQINVILEAFKATVDTTQLEQRSRAIDAQIASHSVAIQRIDLEPICLRYRNQQALVQTRETAYAQSKEALEQSQTAYLTQYFDLTNALYTRLGSGEFEISRIANNRGARMIYELQIHFRGQLIPPEQLNCVFSESDRRAFALCLFLARIDALSAVEKANAIVVMDDPITSFDNERTMMILNKLDELSAVVKQIIVTTHYKGVASEAVAKFGNRAHSVMLGMNDQACSITRVDNDDMTATDHDIAFDRIKGCVERTHNHDIINELRPFLETEVRTRYKQQIGSLGVTKAQFKTVLDALKDNAVISETLWARLNAFRTSLNPPMHSLAVGALDNTRAAAQDVLNVVYNELVPVV